jgi:hypothetical protein
MLTAEAELMGNSISRAKSEADFGRNSDEIFHDAFADAEVIKADADPDADVDADGNCVVEIGRSDTMPSSTLGTLNAEVSGEMVDDDADEVLTIAPISTTQDCKFAKVARRSSQDDDEEVEDSESIEESVRSQLPSFNRSTRSISDRHKTIYHSSQQSLDFLNQDNE